MMQSVRSALQESGKAVRGKCLRESTHQTPRCQWWGVVWGETETETPGSSFTGTIPLGSETSPSFSRCRYQRAGPGQKMPKGLATKLNAHLVCIHPGRQPYLFPSIRYLSHGRYPQLDSGTFLFSEWTAKGKGTPLLVPRPGPQGL